MKSTNQGRSAGRSIFSADHVVLAALAALKLLVHLATNLSGGYGIFRDELYYIACSKHLAWGYVDQPPFSIAALWLNRHVFGDSLFALRILPALAGAAVVFLAGLLVKKLGGDRFAQVLAACCVLAAPLVLSTNGYFSMNSFDHLFWTLAFYLLASIVTDGGRKHWLLLGLVLGLGLLNKLSVLWLGAGLFAGLLLTRERRWLLRREAWSAAAVALFLFLPHLAWQLLNRFPTLEFMRNALADKYVSMSPLAMLREQAMNMNPLTVIVWLPGLLYFLLARQAKPFRIFPVIYATVFLILVVNGNSKSGYLGPLFPMLFALGAVAWERLFLKAKRRWLKPALLALILSAGIALAPFAIAVLPVERFIAYAQVLGLTPSTAEKKELARLPQFYADMFGWEKMAAAVGAAYNTLTPAEKARCTVMGNNYGEAGAIDYFGPQYGLPKAISGHNNYWLWGPRGATGEVVIRLGGSLEALKESYGEVLAAGVFNDEYCMPYENNQTVWICKHRRTPLAADWAEFKHYE